MDNQGEQSLSPEQVAGLVPDLTSPKGQGLVNSFLQKAQKVKPGLDSMLGMVNAQAGLQPQDFESRLKNAETITRKVAVHRKAGKDGYRMNNVNDLYGARFIADTPDQKKQIIDQLHDLSSNNQIKIDKEEQVDHGTYHAYHIDFNHKGVKGEIQVHDPHSLFEAVTNHEIRSKFGEKPPPPMDQIKQANSQMGYQMPAQQAQQVAQTIQAQRASKADLNAKPQLTPEDINTFGQFAQKVETGKSRANMGTLGQTIQSVITNLFGNKAANWTNQQVKDALDQYTQKNYKGR